MKNTKNYLANRVLFLLGILFFYSSCKKESSIVTDGNNLTSKKSSIELNKLKTLELEHSVAKTLAKLSAGNSNFNKAVKDLCLKQKYGDYYIRLSELYTENSLQKFISKDQIENITSLVDQIKVANSGREPIVFIPSVENTDPDVIKNKIALNSVVKVSTNDTDGPGGLPPDPGSQMIYIFGETGGVDNEYFPGYTIDQSGNSSYWGMVGEDFAWNNNVVVLGIQEESSYNPNDDVNSASTNMIKTLSQRNPTRVEIGGRINVTNIKEIEAWIYGKLEMKYFINASSDGASIKQRAFAPIRRADVNNNWLSLNDRIGYWDPAIMGQYQYERWIEEDGGSTRTITQSYPAAYAGGPTITFTINLKSDDQDCGLATVNYNDTFYGEVPLQPSAWTVYNISYMNFQRYSQYQQ